jgi:hypothetical protein
MKGHCFGITSQGGTQDAQIVCAKNTNRRGRACVSIMAHAGPKLLAAPAGLLLASSRLANLRSRVGEPG